MKKKILIISFICISLFLIINEKKNKQPIIDNLDKNLNDTLNRKGVEIDAVITWVNSNDKKWIELKNEYYQKEIDKKIIDNRNIRYTSITKYSEVEVFYCIKSIIKFAPWIRNIYLVVHDNQKPTFLHQFGNKVILIKHSQIYADKYYLPVFNSHSIETCLHLIPGLAEKFIYLNDDMFLGTYVKPSFFFHDNQPIYSANYFHIWFFRDNNSAYQNAWINLSKLYSTKIVLLPTHCCTPLTKTIMNQIENKYNDVWIKTRRTRFRSNKNIPPIGMCLNYENSLLSKHSVNNKCYYYAEGTQFKSWRKNIKKIRPYCFCINNIDTEEQYEILKELFDEIL